MDTITQSIAKENESKYNKFLPERIDPNHHTFQRSTKKTTRHQPLGWAEIPALFPNHRDPGRVLAASSFNHAIARLGYGGRFSAHGFRATATTLLGLLGYPDKLVDLQLAHRRQDASRAPYDHARFVESRTLLMQDWADILDALAHGERYARLSEAFGPLSERRTRMLGVIERE